MEDAKWQDQFLRAESAMNSVLRDTDIGSVNVQNTIDWSETTPEEVADAAEYYVTQLDAWIENAQAAGEDDVAIQLNRIKAYFAEIVENNGKYALPPGDNPFEEFR